MKNLKRNMLVMSVAALLAAPLLAQEIPTESPVPTTALISAASKDNKPLDPAMLKLQVNGHASPITAIRPVVPANAPIAILIDDGLRGSFGLQIQDLKTFIDQLPVGAQVFVGYMENGSVTAAQGFTADHMSAINQLRVPMSNPGISASPYFCLSSFVKSWPSNERSPRFVLMLTNGVDPFNGSTSILNQDSPYVQTAQDDAQRAGVAVYSIFYNDAGVRRGNFSGQSYLQQVADATGGELLSGGITPVSLKPYLNDFQKYIAESYTVSFLASSTHERGNSLTPIKLKTSQPGMKLRVPEAVHPGIVD
jgi:hypothetical protein